MPVVQIVFYILLILSCVQNALCVISYSYKEGNGKVGASVACKSKTVSLLCEEALYQVSHAVVYYSQIIFLNFIY